VREGLGKAGHRAGNDPQACCLPVRQKAGDDIGHHVAWDQRIGGGENGLVVRPFALRGQATGRCIIMSGGQRGGDFGCVRHDAGVPLLCR